MLKQKLFYLIIDDLNLSLNQTILNLLNLLIEPHNSFICYSLWYCMFTRIKLWHLHKTMNNRSNHFGLTVTVKMYGISSIHYLNKQQWAIKHFSRARNIEE